MQTLKLQTEIIYGPVSSRRLGCSLGINLLPTGYKLCSFDCVYCHYGRTQVKIGQPSEDHFLRVEKILTAVERALALHPSIDYLTFSGNGEPTLHPRFLAIVEGVGRLRDQLCPDAKLALLSNSTTAHLPHIREALALIDVPIMKLDAGDEGTIKRINRPVLGFKFTAIIDALSNIPGITIQSMLFAGQLSNVTEQALQAWMNALAKIRPAQIQIYSTDRPVPQVGLERIPPEGLQTIANQVETTTRIPATAYWG